MHSKWCQRLPARPGEQEGWRVSVERRARAGRLGGDGRTLDAAQPRVEDDGVLGRRRCRQRAVRQAKRVARCRRRLAAGIGHVDVLVGRRRTRRRRLGWRDAAGRDRRRVPTHRTRLASCAPLNAGLGPRRRQRLRRGRRLPRPRFHCCCCWRTVDGVCGRRSGLGRRRRRDGRPCALLARRRLLGCRRGLGRWRGVRRRLGCRCGRRRRCGSDGAGGGGDGRRRGRGGSGLLVGSGGGGGRRPSSRRRGRLPCGGRARARLARHDGRRRRLDDGPWLVRRCRVRPSR